LIVNLAVFATGIHWLFDNCHQQDNFSSISPPDFIYQTVRRKHSGAGNGERLPPPHLLGKEKPGGPGGPSPPPFPYPSHNRGKGWGKGDPTSSESIGTFPYTPAPPPRTLCLGNAISDTSHNPGTNSEGHRRNWMAKISIGFYCGVVYNYDILRTK